MEKLKILTLMFSILMIVQVAQAIEVGMPVDENGNQEGMLKVSLTTPKIIFRDLNVSDTAEYYVGVKNRNDFPVEISIVPPEDLDITFDQETTFTLQPSEEAEINYEITITEMGNYTEIIGVNFAGGGKKFGLQQSVQFSNIHEKERSSVWFWIIILGVIIIMAIIIVLFVKGKKRKPVEGHRELYPSRNEPPPQTGHSDYPKFDLRGGSHNLVRFSE